MGHKFRFKINKNKVSYQNKSGLHGIREVFLNLLSNADQINKETGTTHFHIVVVLL